MDYDGVPIPKDKFVIPKKGDIPSSKRVGKDDDKKSNESGSGMKVNVGDGNGGIKSVDTKTMR